MQGCIFDIQRFSLDDGPGIRTTVFLKGCPLSCRWCHNPEGLSPKAVLLFYPQKCVGCGGCAVVCPHDLHTVTPDAHLFDRETCITCGACAAVCRPGALSIAGRTATAQEVVETALRDKAFYKREGGITVSGGEPLMQPHFTAEILRLAKEKGLHTCMETSGFASEAHFRAAAQHLDLLYLDIKATGRTLHKELTGVYPDRTLHNLSVAGELGLATVLTCPMIPGANMTEEHSIAIAELAKAPHVQQVILRPYHKLGLSKETALGHDTPHIYEEPDRTALEEICRYITELSGTKAVIS